MGRQAGQPERKSLAKAAANRRNAAKPRVASRRGSEAAEEELKLCVEALRTGALEAVALLERVMTDRLFVVRDGQRVRVRVPPGVRLKAATEWMDRCGLVRRSEQTVEITTEPKLVIIRDDWPAPPSRTASEGPTLTAHTSASVNGAGGVEDVPFDEVVHAEADAEPEPVQSEAPAAPVETPRVEALRERSCPQCGDDDELMGTKSADGSLITWRCLGCNAWWREKAAEVRP
jgi:hypothetical protein